MRIFITGGSGFVGGHLIEDLTRDHQVLAMARSDRSAQVVAAYGAEPVRCSLDDVSPEHLSGVDVVVHAAAYVEEYGPRSAFEAINVRGTERLLAAAREAGVTRFVHIGTEAALFTGAPLVDVDESVPVPEPRAHRFLYSETKARAEAAVLAVDADGFTTLSLRPSFVWGPRDTTVLPALHRMVDAGSFAWLDRGEHAHSTTHVANLVAAVRAALTRGRGGHAYFIADDERRTLRAFLTDVAASDGLSLPERSLPGWLVRPLGRLLEGTWRTLGLTNPPPLTGFAVASMSREVTVVTDKARRELGWRPVVSVEEGLAGLRAAA